jgi:hypothetical protein
MSVVVCALDFVLLCRELSAEYTSLDLWLMGWAKWVLDPKFLFSTAAAAAEFSQKRREQCGEKHKFHSKVPQTFRTYMNALQRVNNSSGGVAIIPSSKRQFPEFNRLMTEVLKKERGARAVRMASSESGVLLESELEKLFGKKPPCSVFHDQRWNILVVGFRTGLRSEVLRRLQVESFAEGVTEDGMPMLTIVVGSMKNMPSDLARADAAMFKQVVVSSVDERFCAMAAIKRQMALVAKAPRSSEEGENFLFRSCTLNNVRLSAGPTTEEMYRGLAKWTSDTLGRKMTFKDIARRAAMTRLANASEVPLAEVAKYFGVHTNKIQIYHQAGKNMAQLAAAILSGVKGERVEAVKAEPHGGEAEAEVEQGPPAKKRYFEQHLCNKNLLL